jgi:alkylhydroperoxidase family enzyme
LAEKVKATSVLGPGVTAAQLREAVFNRAQGNPVELPPELARWADRVAKNAWDATSSEVDALRAAGHSEDAIFELTVSAALGASLSRLDRALDLLGDVP